MSGRAVSGRNRAWLLGEMDVWRAGGVLSEEQAMQILDLYETPTMIAQRKRSLALFTLMGLAVFMVGLAVHLLIGFNWEKMPAAIKLPIIFGAVFGTHAVGFYLRYLRQARLLSEIAFFLGCLFYGAGIWLVAQVFHIPVHYPTGFWFWAVGILPFVLCLDTILLHVLFAALLAIWAGTEVIGFPNLGAWLFGRWGALPNGAYTLPLLALPGLLWAYQKKSPVTVGLYAPVLAWWVILQPIAWHWEVNAVYFIGAVGALFLLVAESHRAGSSFAIPYRSYGLLLTAGVLVPLSFFEFNQEMLREMLRGNFIMMSGLLAGLVVVLLSAGVIALAALLNRTYGAARTPVPDQMMSILRQQWLPVGLLLVMAVLPMTNTLLGTRGEPTFAALLPTVLANVAMVSLGLWLMHVGLRDDRLIPFAAGVAYFLLWTVLRYVDLFGDVGGMRGAAAMFFLCGVTLFGVAVYWRKRKEVRDV